MQNRYEQLKAQFIAQITQNGAKRSRVERNIRHLQEAYREKEDRLLQSVKDTKIEDDPRINERALARLQEEKAALDDATLDVLEGRTKIRLPVFDEATHAVRKITGLPQRRVTVFMVVLKALLMTVLIALAFSCLISLFFAAMGLPWSHGIAYYYKELSFFDATYLTLQKCISGELLEVVFLPPIFYWILFTMFFFRCFDHYRKRN